MKGADALKAPDPHAMALTPFAKEGEGEFFGPGEIVLEVGDDHPFERRARAHLVNGRELGPESDDDSGATIDELVLQFAGDIERTDGNSHCPKAQRRVEGDDILR